MAKLRHKIPAVVEASKRTEPRYERILDSNVDGRKKRIRVGDYVYTPNDRQKNKLKSKTVGKFAVFDADDSTYVVDLNGEKLRVNSDRVIPAPRASTPEETRHPLPDGLDKQEGIPPVPEEFVIDRLLGF